MHPVPRDAVIEAVRARTPARLLLGAAGTSYRTATELALRADHAAARDAVLDEIDTPRDLPNLVEVTTLATSKQQYLLRPDLGRQLSPAGRARIQEQFPRQPHLQVFVGDGLSAAAVRVQVPALLPVLLDRARDQEWSVGVPFFVRYCRVGVLNDVGDAIDPLVCVLLIGERPGLATESLSAYLAYRPRRGDTDARRNLISNIHGRGVPIDQAVVRILALADRMRRLQKSGVEVKEELTTLGSEDERLIERR